MCELHAWRSSGRRSQHVFSTYHVSGDDYMLFLNPPSKGWSWRASSCMSVESTMFGSKTPSWLEPPALSLPGCEFGPVNSRSLCLGFFFCELMTLKRPRRWLKGLTSYPQSTYPSAQSRKALSKCRRHYHDQSLSAGEAQRSEGTCLRSPS